MLESITIGASEHTRSTMIPRAYKIAACEALTKGYVTGAFNGLQMTCPGTHLNPIRLDAECLDAGRLTAIVMPCAL